MGAEAFFCPRPVTFHFSMADRAGEEEGFAGEGAAQIDIATLRKNATEAGAPAGLPDVALTRWIHLSGAPFPRAVRSAGGFVISKTEKKETQMDTYGGYFKPEWHENKFKLACMMRCGSDHTARGKVQEGPGR